MSIAPDPIDVQQRRAELAQSQAALRLSLQKLENVAREELDLGRRLAEYSPFIALAGFTFGLWLGSRPSTR
jgi:hypothetical protein